MQRRGVERGFCFQWGREHADRVRNDSIKINECGEDGYSPWSREYFSRKAHKSCGKFSWGAKDKNPWATPSIRTDRRKGPEILIFHNVLRVKAGCHCGSLSRPASNKGRTLNPLRLEDNEGRRSTRNGKSVHVDESREKPTPEGKEPTLPGLEEQHKNTPAS